MKQLILKLLATKIKDLDALRTAKRHFADEMKLKDLPSNIQLLQEYRKLLEQKKIKKNPELEKLLKKRAIRSSSWIVAIQVLTKPFPCPGQCIFCPNDPTMPKSYIKSEPGAMRALLNHFDPTKQVRNRLTSLTLTWHDTDKIEMIVLWGTWDVYTEKYKTNFIKALYAACNNFSQLKIIQNIDEKKGNKFGFHLEGKEKTKTSKTIQEAMKRNESAEHRIIGLTIETRPEYVTDKNCQKRRELWVTRIEMGIQSLDNDVLKANKRGLTVEQIRRACHRLRQYWFKFSVHIMPGLYTSTYAKDLKTFQDLYTDPFLKPDEIKFYPTSVIPNTELCKLYKQGKYKPLESKEIQKLITETFLHIIPPYTRIKRLIRDIPANEIVAGSKITNLSQLMHNEIRLKMGNWKLKMKELYWRLYPDYKLFKNIKEFLHSRFPIPNKPIPTWKKVDSLNTTQTFIIWVKPDIVNPRNFVCLDTRSREIRNKTKDERWKKKEIANLIIRKYTSSVGEEYFISFEDELGYLYGFTRLLLPKPEEAIDMKWLGRDTAIIRELHVYGNMEQLKSSKVNGLKSWDKVQHSGFGKQLMDIAEKISKQAKYKKLSVISGIGVRAYYRKLWYKKVGEYMVKEL